ncbi:MAG: hypothetical protein BGO14_08615 [Chlamydiales bacterium 38-26]|nr:putative sugar O-methyltransferase [Chlamydiales bacterium]OJV11050.1 MAG: hypothetical protein BGO14_08615 [Chlamydiales bacterium 38-26]
MTIFSIAFPPIFWVITLFLTCSSTMLPGQLFHRQEALKATPGCTVESNNNDTPLIQRLIQSYQLSDLEQSLGDSMWQYIFDHKHVHIHEIFKKGVLNEVADILRHPADTDLFYGIDGLSYSTQEQFHQFDQQKAHAELCLDGLVRFAEAIGAIFLDNPEATHLPIFVYDVETVLEKIEQHLNLNLSFPNPYPKEHGLLCSKGVISYRVPQALYQAWKIKQLVKNIKNPRILEIGAGLGRTAYYARLMGIQDYTIVDLPLTAISSGYFLGTTLGADQILLKGESQTDAKNRIKIINMSDFIDGHEIYDLVLNVDSMTEMDPQIAKKYWKKIERCTNKLLSINHEINPFRISDLINSNNSSIDSTRSPYWMRAGYVEEVIHFSSNK